MASTTPKGPFKLVTVNTSPERAARLIGRMIEALKDRYTIIHERNITSELSMKQYSVMMLIDR